MAETRFSVRYAGPALVDGRMPIRDLAPALIALGDLFVEAGQVVLPGHEPVSLEIKATQEGSFIVELILSLPQETQDIFTSKPVDAVLKLKESVLLVGGGLLWFIARLRKRRIARREPSPIQAGYIRVYLVDGTIMDVPAETLQLYDDKTAVKQARDVVEPLRREGVDTVQFSDDAGEALTVDSDAVEYFELPVADEVLINEVDLPMTVTLASVSFTEGTKWRLSDGERTFYAAVEDQAFLQRVESGAEVFGKGDRLECQVRRTQTDQGGDLSVSYTVLRVDRHIPRPQVSQLSMNWAELPPADETDERPALGPGDVDDPPPT